MRILSLFLLVILCSCGQQRMGTVQGHAPRVALVPVIDRTNNHDVSWNLSHELTSLLRKDLSKQEGVDVREARKARLVHNPFGEKLDWMKNQFGKSEFVVFTELVRHEQEARGRAGMDADADFKMDIRIRLIDLRGKTPRIILQEIITQSTHLPRPFTKWNFYQTPWGEENYHISPTAMAHAQLSKETSQRIRDYLRLALSL